MDRLTQQGSTRILIFTSPKAGSGTGREQVPRLETLLCELGVEVRVVHQVDQLRRLVNEDTADGEHGDTIVVAAGGDGTLSLACATLFLSDQNRPQSPEDPSSSLAEVGRSSGHVAVLPMPLGTENLLARHFGQLADADDVLRTIRHGQLFKLDAGLANGKPFLVMATCGFDAEVVREMHERRQGHISRFSYLVPVVNTLLRYRFPKLSLNVDGKDIGKCCWVMSFNLPKYGGGLKIEPNALGDDGLLDVIVFERGSIASGLRYVAGIWTGRHLNAKDVKRLQGTKIRVDSRRPVAYQLDGDFGGQLPIEITTLPAAVPLLIPAVDK
ncbi:MAG: diacylglycerol kinase family lipid kinase [Rubripirellula sp.]|nr:diacylglycerol kinase family lipid kinase [Rubripirellula sp.]